MTAVDNELRCNLSQCRAQLGVDGQAVVTTCSLDCANQYFGERQCPACDQPLNDDDDIVFSHLSPTTNYKTTILAGMTPGLILDIATRALGFWSYQTSAEAAYQSALLQKSEAQTEEARQAYGSLNNDLARAQRAAKEYEHQLNIERRRSHGFEQALKEKDRELLKLKGMSDNMMKRAVLGNAVQNGMMRPGGSQQTPVDATRQIDRRRMMSNTPIATSNAQQNFRPTPNVHNVPQSVRRAPVFPQIPSTTQAYSSRPSPAFQLHPKSGSGQAATAASQRVARDVQPVQQRDQQGRSQRTGSDAPSEDGRRLRSRQAVGPAYYGAP
ncbi:uncharacterized protein MKK02DRAFT_42677 [Dioszegia hungarica]|uniref:Cyclin B1 interacting protein 1 n=1 Tax=Dioszegia hungarica TaxID=4972 RepID=A0AA38HE21_9TREE|nr:uncharacterized protein MKK02DRAFT_42677 [Dioszegia hungarica]KAI9638287.1 hypothetical protein MKK02DRAFT_42677 [Dioszegia hungarica]